MIRAHAFHPYGRTAFVCLGLLLFTQSTEAQKRYSNDPIKPAKLDRKTAVSYGKEVYPILKARCMFCHSGNVVEGMYDMGTFQGLVKGGKRGNAIVPGKSKESLLFLAAAKEKSPRMPPRREKPLTPEELALIGLWIDQGAKGSDAEVGPEKIVVGLPPSSVQPVRAVAISPDKKMVVGSLGNRLHVYDPEKGTLLRSLIDPAVRAPNGQSVDAAHITLVEALAFSPDGKQLVSGSFQEIKFWEPTSGKLIRTIDGFADRVVSLAYSPDGKMVATGGGPPTLDGEIKIFEAASGKQILDLKNAHSDQVFGVCFNPDGKMLATCGADKFVKTWEIPSGKFVKAFEGHTHHVMDVGWKGDGKVLASAGADNVVKIWDFAKGEQQRTINAHGKQVTRLQFVGKTSNFVTCSGDQTARIWNADNGRTVRNFSGNKDFLYAVAVSPDGQMVVAGGEEGVVRVWDGRNGRLLKTLEPKVAEDPKKEPAKKK